MPQETLGGADRIRRIRQRIEAGTALPPGAVASDSTDSRVGRIWRLEDGCCSNPYRIVFVDENSGSYDPTFTRLSTCTLYIFPNGGVPAGTVITIHNSTVEEQGWQIGAGPTGCEYQALVSSSTQPGSTSTYITAGTAVSLYFGCPCT
jgi:hypothetical protein